MFSKSSHCPAIAVAVTVALLLVTFWRSNMGAPYLVHGNDAAKLAAAKSASKSGSSSNKDKDKPRYIFVDLGANAADSLEAFLKHPNAKFEYDFPAPKWAKHEDAEIFLFEANPVFNDHLVNAKQHYAALGKQITIYPSTVVDTKDGTRVFYLDNVNTDKDFWGSSTLENHPDAIASGGKGTELSAINISRWLLMNTLPHDFVVVKMDVEGAEYELLPHMVEMRVWTVVDHLLIEWHDYLPTNEMRQSATEATEKLQSEGVNCPPYDSAA